MGEGEWWWKLKMRDGRREGEEGEEGRGEKEGEEMGREGGEKREGREERGIKQSRTPKRTSVPPHLPCLFPPLSSFTLIPHVSQGLLLATPHQCQQNLRPKLTGAHTHDRGRGIDHGARRQRRSFQGRTQALVSHLQVNGGQDGGDRDRQFREDLPQRSKERKEEDEKMKR